MLRLYSEAFSNSFFWSRHVMFQRALLIAAIMVFASAHAFALYKLERGLSAKSPTQVSLAVTGD